MKLFLSPWRSATPRALSKHLGSRLRRLDTVDRLKAQTIINWGCSSLHGCEGVRVLNKPSHVGTAANKKSALMWLTSKQVATLEWTINREIALDWNKKHSVVAHSDVHGHSGSGLVRLEPGTTLDKFPYFELYTKYFQKDTEVRVLCIRHGATYETMFLEKKRIKPERYADFGLEGKPDWFIRTYDNGWIFSREADPIPGTTELAKATMLALGLDFGAVDILCKKKSDGTWGSLVGEVNTAPGLEGQTLEFFKDGLTRLIKEAA